MYPNWQYNNPGPFTVPSTPGYFAQNSANYYTGSNNNFTNLIRVKGEEGAKAYPVGANSSVALFDEDSDIFYLKTTDSGGFPSIRKFRFMEEAEHPIEVSPTSTDEYVSKDKFNELSEQLVELQVSMDELRKAVSDGKQPIRQFAPTSAG